MKSVHLAFAGLAALTLAACAPNGVQITNGGSQALVTKNITVARGQTVKVQVFTSINPDCTETPGTSGRMESEPAHGMATLSRTQDFVYFKPENPRSNCNSRRVPAWVVNYTAAADFVGEDTFAFDEFFAAGGSVHFNVVVHAM